MGGACSRACDFIRGQKVARPLVGGASGAEQMAKPLDGAVHMERLRLRQVAEDDELFEELPFERWSDLNPKEYRRYRRQHERHLAECDALHAIIRDPEYRPEGQRLVLQGAHLRHPR